MRVMCLWLALIIYVSLISPLFNSEVSGFCSLSGTGVGIRVDGPEQAYIGERIEYVITVHNLGDYWMRNVTITDTFPNQTSSSWQIPDLAPLGQSGNSFNVSNILYTIRHQDMLLGNPSYIINHAEVTGYSDIQGLKAPAVAKTNYLTFILSVPVGGYSFSIKAQTTTNPSNIHTALLAILMTAFTLVRRKTHKRIE